MEAIAESAEEVVGFEAGRMRDVIPGRLRCRGGEFDGERDRERFRFVAAEDAASGTFADVFHGAVVVALADTSVDASSADFADTCIDGFFGMFSMFAAAEPLADGDALDDDDAFVGAGAEAAIDGDVAFAGSSATVSGAV